MSVQVWHLTKGRGWRAFLAAMTLSFTTQAAADTLSIFAASSLKETIDDIALAFERQTDMKVSVSYAGSALLARQVAAGAPADIFLSASSDWSDYLIEQGVAGREATIAFASNSLVLVASAVNPPVFGDDIGNDPYPNAIPVLLENGPLAIAFADAVPAGIYAKAALSRYGLWDRLRPHAVQTDSVRAALALVALGEAPLGIVYHSDAMAEPRVRKLWTFPPSSHPPIRYMAVDVSRTDVTRRFLQNLAGPKSRKTLEQHGFIPLHIPQ